ncbi:MAG TPA: acetate--CoA ligase family protein, partial [Acidobacteriota bacterium]|nr:acetate--CoA ligase family protein [Acidobacteriota bacterium]
MKSTLEHHDLPSTEAPQVGRTVLLETEGYALVRELGIIVPRSVLVRNSDEAADLNLNSFSGSRLVIKVVSPKILHKTDVGGVRIVARDRSLVVETVQEMERRLAHPELAGFLICEFVEHDPSPGGELLLSTRWSPDFGPLVFLGIGGTTSEFLSASIKSGRRMAVLTPAFHSEEDVEFALQEKTIVPLVTGTARGAPVRMSNVDLVALLRRVLAFASRNMPDRIRELEINPLVLTDRGPVALDVLCRTGSGCASSYPDRPIHKLKNLLEPASIAIAGVSEKMNPGHIILKNILASGFPPEKICVIKPGLKEIDGCKCVPDVTSMQDPADLLILSIDAHQIPEVMGQVISGRKAESAILISGGLGERKGTGDLEHEVRSQLAGSRNSCWKGPLLNGGNCLGIRSVPGRYDTLFIPSYKLRFPDCEPAPLAVIAQSGA